VSSFQPTRKSPRHMLPKRGPCLARHTSTSAGGSLAADSPPTRRTRRPKMQTMQQCTGHWNPFAGRRPALGHGVPGRRPARPALGHGSAGRRLALSCTGARPALGHGSAGRRPALACTGGTSECRAAGRRPALAGPKARHCGARSVRAAQ